MSAEVNTERMKFDDAPKAAKILRKPEAIITADDLKFIEQRIAKREIARESPSSSSSGLNPGKGNRAEDDAIKGKPRAAPAVERTPDPPAKRLKGAPKGAAERAPSGSKGAQKGAAIRAESASSSGKRKREVGRKGEAQGRTCKNSLCTPLFADSTQK